MKNLYIEWQNEWLSRRYCEISSFVKKEVFDMNMMRLKKASEIFLLNYIRMENHA